MKQFDYEKVEKVIGYQFNNKKLLKQAFFRSSFAHENNRESNEVLEFVGDKVLDLAVMRILLEKYGKSNSGLEYFKTSKQEGELTKIKSQLVSTGHLSTSFDDLNLEKYIYFGKSDINNNTKDVVSIKEDTFEAIIGAIALDSNWNMDKIIKIVKKLLNTDKFLKQSEIDTNYVGLLQEYAASLGLDEPFYLLELPSKDNLMMWQALVKIKGVKPQSGSGPRQKEARKEAAKKMIQYIKEHQKEIEQKRKPQKQKEDVFATINSLIQAGEIDKPVYEFEESYDNNGNPCWECSTTIPELGYIYLGYGTTKKEAQKNSLDEALKDLR